METNPAPLVGRAAEMDRLVAVLDEATAGRGGVVLLAGEPGIGKTRLASEFTRHAERRGARVLWGRCHETAGAPPFWPWIQLLQAALAASDDGALPMALGLGAAELAQLLPALRTDLPDLPHVAPLPPEEARFRLFEAVRDFLAAAANNRPHVLVLDDLHWADTPSLLLLQFLARELAARPLLVLGAYRDGEVARGHPLAQTLAALVRVDGARLIQLTGLSTAAVGDYLSGVFDSRPPPALVVEITDRSGGNPFFLGELARVMVSASPGERSAVWATSPALPAGARAVLDQWLQGCSSACLAVLSAAAVIGRDFSLDVLAQLTDFGAEAVLDALDEAEAARIITPLPGVGGRYSFVHALLREHLYTQISAARRLRLHQRACVALERVYGADDTRLADLAHHAFEAAPLGDAARSVRYARRAGDQAMAQVAYEEAVRQYGRALEAQALAPPVDHEQRGTLLLALGGAQNAIGDTSAAEATFARAAAEGRASGVAAMLARAALGFGGQRMIGEAGADRRRVALLEEALAALDVAAGEDGVAALRVQVLIRLSEALRAPGDLARRRGLTEEAVAVAGPLGDPRLLGAALSARCGARWGPDEMAAVVADAREMLALAQESGDRAMALQARHWLILDLLARGALHSAAVVTDDFIDRAAAARDPLARWQAAALLVLHAQLRGRFGEAEALAAEARALGERVNRANAEESFEHQVFIGRVLREGWGNAIPLIEAAQEHFSTFPGWRALLALAYADVGRVDDARRELDRLAVHDFTDLSRGPRWLHILAMLAHTSALLGDRRRALLLYALLEPHAGSAVFATDGLIWQGATDYYLGMLAATLGRWAAATRHFDDALALYADNDVPVWVARAQQAYAEMLLARGAPGDEEDARALRVQALATERRLGLSAVVAPIQPMRQRTTGVPPAPLPDGLTARESEVLRLLAVGRSNAQIASALVLSVRTVERHIMNLYPKIGAHNRAEATAYAIHHYLA